MIDPLAHQEDARNPDFGAEASARLRPHSDDDIDAGQIESVWNGQRRQRRKYVVGKVDQVAGLFDEQMAVRSDLRIIPRS